MTFRRMLSVLVLLAVASLACSINTSNPTSAPPTSAPAASKTPANFHNGGLTPGAPTEVATSEEQPTETPTKAPKPTKAPTKVATKVPTQAAQDTPTDVPQNTSACTAFQANGDLFWYTIDQNKNTTKVTSYPSGSTSIDAAFNYDCNPSAITVIGVWSANGKQEYSDKNKLDASDTAAIFSDGIVYRDKSGAPIAVPDGEYGVQFLVGKQPIASGTVTVGGGGGGGGGGGAQVTVQGIIIDKASGKPISGAFFGVLVEGVTYQQWVNDNNADKDVLTVAQTDSSGQFTLPDKLKRNTTYSINWIAKGYRPNHTDKFIINDSDPDPTVLEVQMAK